MYGIPKRLLPGVLIALASIALALNSCNSTNSTPSLPSATNGGGGPPPTSASPSAHPSASAAPSTSPTASPSAPASHSPSPSPKPTPTATATPIPTPTVTPTTLPLACSAPAAAIPGTYTSILALGNVSGTTFTASAGTSLWTRQHYTAATPAPTPSISPTTLPSTSPSPSPTPQPVYVYEGTYKVVVSGATETNGCAILVTSQDGAPLSGTAYNGENLDDPNFAQPVNGTFVASGSVSSMTISNLSANGGTGSFTLSDNSTGTVTLTSRVAFPSAAAARAFIHH